MNKLLNKVISIGLSASLALGIAVSAYAGEEKSSVSEKTETVYALADADGKVSKIIVSDHLTNPDGADKISDKSSLDDIENVKGDEDFTRSGDTITWNANGADIFYQGTTDKELPISMKVTYTLDGKTVSADEIAGKSGHVTIRFDFENRQAEKLGDENVYVPFVTLTAAILDNDVFKNVVVSGGKIADDGTKTTVIGYTFPGLRESLGVSEDKMKLPGYFEIAADAENFKMGNTFTVVTNEVFNNIDLHKLSSLNDLGQLSDGTAQLLNGSNQLVDGMAELIEKSGGLVQGIDALADGSASLEAGAKAIDSGAAELKAGAEQLSSGLDVLAGSSETLNSGAEQVFVTLLATADEQLKAAGLEIPKLTIENYGTVLDGVIAKLGEKAETVKALKQSLDSYNEFYTGLLNYTGGVADAANGAKTLYAGAEKLNGGASELYSGAEKLSGGIDELKSSLPALTEGINQLSDGANKLRDGISELDEKGISKIAALGGTLEKFKELKEISNGYTNFSGIGSNCSGSVKFVIRTESVE